MACFNYFNGLPNVKILWRVLSWPNLKILPVDYYMQVLSIAQLVGVVLCLNAASKISHRAQSLGAIASRWHALVTCNSNDVSGSGILDNGGDPESVPAGSLPVNYSESDLESSDYVPLPTSGRLTSSTSSYNRRQAFGMDIFIYKFLSNLSLVE